MRQKLKLSHRLHAIKDMIITHDDVYDRIWDTCCDHGLLGAALIESEGTREIVFVDIVPALVEEVHSKLTQHYSKSNVIWQTLCVDVAKLPLETPFYSGENCRPKLKTDNENISSKKQLVVIAGVGGDLMADFVESLTQKNNELAIPLNLDFLLCPVHHNFKLRTKLRDLKFNVLNEQVIKDNNRFYEVMLVTNDDSSGRIISPVGEKIWQYQSDEQRDQLQQYLTKTVEHYKRMQNSREVNAASIIEAYEAVDIK